LTKERAKESRGEQRRAKESEGERKRAKESEEGKGTKARAVGERRGAVAAVDDDDDDDDVDGGGGERKGGSPRCRDSEGSDISFHEPLQQI